MALEEALVEATADLNSDDMSRVEKAGQFFESLLNGNDRKHPGLWFAVATVFMRHHRYALAEALYEHATKLDPTFAEPYNNLGYICNIESRHDEAWLHFQRALALAPNRAEFISNMATFFVNTGQPEKCIEWANRAIAAAEADPEASDHDARWNRALARLEMGEWEAGWQDYRAGLHSRFTSSQKRKMRHYGEEDKVPYWDGTAGKTVVVYGEQGVGDEILAASMLSDLMEKCEVIYEAHPRLVTIMRHSFPDIPIYGTRKQEWKTLQFPQWHGIDAKIPIFGLGEFFRNKNEDFPRTPYLKPFDEKVEKYREWLDGISDRPKIGVSWKGGSSTTRFDLRSIPLGGFLPIFKELDADFIALQYDPADRMGWNAPIIESFEKDNDIDLHYRPEVVNDLDECYGGLLHALDLVISVNTSLIHACGAYGVPCFVLTPSRPAWRYNVAGHLSIPDDEMVWYGKHVRQFRQVGNDWDPVLEQVIHAVRSGGEWGGATRVRSGAAD